jgi:hypothetical protein
MPPARSDLISTGETPENRILSRHPSSWTFGKNGMGNLARAKECPSDPTIASLQSRKSPPPQRVVGPSPSPQLSGSFSC